nr:putative zinc finger, CCHC-type [Tanacetum cinerariifolium]
MDLDHALRIDPPAALSAESTADQKRAYEQWGSVEEQFKGNSKAHASTLIRKMLTTKYDRVSGVREHIMMMSDMANKLKGMDMKGFLVPMPFMLLPLTIIRERAHGRAKGCPAEAKLYNPQSLKLDLKTISFFFIEYPERSKGYRFYFPSYSIRIVETRHAEILENANNSGSRSFRIIELREAHDETPIIHVPIPINTMHKGKITKRNEKGATQSTGLLELIHTDIYGPFPSGVGGHKSFITFVDDYSNYMYLFLVNEKSESLEMFKMFKAEVENQHDGKIKVVISNRGGEYYGRYTDVGKAPGSFFDFCKDHGIINQYTMSDT